MKAYLILKQSVQALARNKGRSFLTILGIIIGISSVIALISLGTGVRATIDERIATLGATNLTVTPGQRNFGPESQNQNRNGGRAGFGGGGEGQGGAASTLTPDDLKSFSDTQKHPKIKAITGNVNGTAVFTVNGNQERDTIVGTSPAYFSIQNLSVKSGRTYNQNDLDGKAKVTVLGSDLANSLFPGADPVGKTLPIENDTYSIVGVLNAANETGFANPNLNGFIPNTAAFVTFNVTNFNSITVQAIDQNSVDDVKNDIQNTLLADHKITDPKLADFSVLSPKDLLSAVSGITGTLTSLLAGIAAISLVVGGIGIMNIMLVAVTERTREIGLRKAVGAKTSDILSQFITEAILLTVSGGVLGIGLGFLIGRVLTRFIGFAPIITSSAILLAVGVSTAVGLIFGIYPAAKAARLNPIDALRYE